MRKEDETEVLIVGAGPVGLVTAILLAERGIAVQIVDQAHGRAARSYGCALHPWSLQLLDQLGIASDIIDQGHKIESVAFYEGKTRRAEIAISQISKDYPYLVSLPQSTLEGMLESVLQNRHKIKVHWNHRCADFQPEGQTVLATIERLGETAKGYIVPEWEWVVEKTTHTRAAFLVGADGPKSHVRQIMKIGSERLSPLEHYAVYEFDCSEQDCQETRIVAGKKTVDGCWPLPNGKCRWSFQIPPDKDEDEFPSKETLALRVHERVADQEIKDSFQHFIEKRAPWFECGIEDFDWSKHVQFEPHIAQKLGLGHCWLAGDAAHQASPLGMHSMNAGFQEVKTLAGLISKVLRETGTIDLLDRYDSSTQEEWKQVVAGAGKLKVGAKAPAWIKQHAKQLVPCLPAWGEDLRKLLGDLGLKLP